MWSFESKFGEIRCAVRDSHFNLWNAINMTIPFSYSSILFKKQLPHSNGLSGKACAPPNLFFFQFGQLWLKNFMLYSYSVFLFIFARFCLRGHFAWGGTTAHFPWIGPLNSARTHQSYELTSLRVRDTPTLVRLTRAARNRLELVTSTSAAAD